MKGVVEAVNDILTNTAPKEVVEFDREAIRTWCFVITEAALNTFVTLHRKTCISSYPLNRLKLTDDKRITNR